MKKRFALVLCLISATAQAQFAVPSFVNELFHYGPGVTNVEFDGQGRVYATEKQGRLLQFALVPESTPTVLLDLITEVDADLEGGLLGMALAPDFAISRWIYLYFTSETQGPLLVRYRLNADFGSLDVNSRELLLSGLPDEAAFHKSGDIQFRPGDDQAIYLMSGDDGNRPAAQDLDLYQGKLLRIDRETGLGLTDNPFYNGDASSVRSRIWGLGLRNAFRFTFYPTTVGAPNAAYLSENGDGTDRIAWMAEGANGNWNSVGDGSVGCPGGCFLDPADPNFRILQRIEPSQIGIAIATSGPFAVNDTPTLYAGNWFPNEFSIRRWTMTGAELDALSPIAADGGAPFYNNAVAVDMEFGPDGCLYYTQSGGDEAAFDGGIQRICYTAGSPPVASFSTNPAPPLGSAPLSVQFTDTSSDDDGMIVTWAWDFGDGNNATVANPMHVYQQPGNYLASLTVTDDSGQTASAETAVAVFTPGVTIDLDLTLLDARSLPVAANSAAIDINLLRLDRKTPLEFDDQPVATITTSGNGAQANVQVDLLDAGFVIELSSSAYVTQIMGVAATDDVSVTRTLYFSDQAVAGQALTARGEPIDADIGAFDSASGAPIEVGGGRDYLLGSGLNPTGVAHRIDTEDFGYFYLALPAVASDVRLTVGEDRNTQRLGTMQATVTSPNGDVSLVVGQEDGGLICDDLSSLPSQTVNYDQLQSIWDTQCIGCHAPGSPNSFGLDLTLLNSIARVVDQPSVQAPGIDLVRPGSLAASFLFEKVNCQDPQAGSRMRPTEAMDLNLQATIRDFILGERLFTSGFEVGSTN